MPRAPPSSALIGLSADIDADNNVGVLASNQDGIDVFAGAIGGGGSTGVGLSLVVDQISGGTTASITGAGTLVDARAAGTGVLTVNSGTLAHAFDVSTINTPDLTTPDQTETTVSVHGLAVAATSHQSVVAYAVTAGLRKPRSPAAAAIEPVVNIMGGVTLAAITGAGIDTRLTVSAAVPQIDVTASSHSYSANFAIALAIGGNAGAGAIVTNQMDRETYARVTGATIGGTVAVGAVTVTAKSTQDTSVLSAGAAGGGLGGGAGSLVVNLFGADTEATLDRGSVTAASLAVMADNANGYIGAAGAAAIGGDGGIAASFVISISNDTTLATIGDLTASNPSTTLALSGALTVSATTENHFTSYSIGGALGGEGALAGAADVTVVSNTTRAGLYGVALGQVQAAGSVTVTGGETIDINSVAGGVALGVGAGLGAGANVVILASSVNADVVDSSINATGAVAATATSDRDIGAITVTAGAGGSVGIGAGIAVLLVGGAVTSDALGQLDAGGAGTLSSMNMAGNATPSDGVAITVAGAPAALPATSYDNGVSNAVAAPKLDGVTADISGGSVTANTVTVRAAGTVSLSSSVYGVGIGLGGAGVGAAVGYTTLQDNISATITQATISASTVTLTATMADGNSGHASDVEAYAGAGSLGTALGAAVAYGDVNNNVTASLGGTVTGASSVSVTADDGSSVNSGAFGAVVGGGAALGISSATAEKTSQVSALIATSSSITSTGAVGLTATGEGSVAAKAIAGAGGISVAGAGAEAQATDSSTILAAVQNTYQNGTAGTTSVSTGAGAALTLTATDTPDASATSIGVAVAGGLGLGASVALATVSPTVTASIDGSTTLSGGNLTEIASTALAQDGTNAATNAVAGAGGILCGATAPLSHPDNDSNVTASLGNNITVPAGVISISASNTTYQSASATGITVGGLLAIGAVVSSAEADTTTTASIGNNLSTPQVGSTSLSLSAVGNDTDVASATAGAGGAISGAGAGASTTDDSTVKAAIGTNANVLTNLFAINAAHSATYGTQANSINAAALGASASVASNDVTSNVTVTIGASGSVNALAGNVAACLGVGCTPSIDILASNAFTQLGGESAKAGAGGGINGAGATSGATLTGNADINLGTGVSLASGVDPTLHPGSTAIVAFTTLNAADVVDLQTGGLLQGAGTDSSINATLNNAITVGSQDAITSWGQLDIGTYTQATASTNSLVSTFGLAAVGSTSAETNVTTNQSVTVLASNDANHPTEIYAFGNIAVTAGKYVSGGFTTQLNGNATAEGYVRGLIAVPLADASTNMVSNASLDLQSGSLVEGVQTIVIGAYHGTPVAAADGTGHGYELEFIPVTDGSSNPSTATSSVVTINGTVTAGIYHDLEVTIGCASACGLNDVPTFTQSSGAPVTASYQGAF